MKRLVRWLFRLVILLVVLVVALLLLKDTILKEVAENRIRTSTGLEARIGKFELGLLSPTLTITDFRIYNPPGFGGAPFVKLPELHFEYDWSALRERRLRLRLVRLNLQEVDIVEDAYGRSNLDALQEVLKTAKPMGGFEVEFEGIDTFNLSIGQVRRYKLADPARAEVTNVNIRDEVMTNLETQADFVVAVTKLFLKYGMRNLTGAMPHPGLGVPAPATVRSNGPALRPSSMGPSAAR